MTRYLSSENFCYEILQLGVVLQLIEDVAVGHDTPKFNQQEEAFQTENTNYLSRNLEDIATLKTSQELNFSPYLDNRESQTVDFCAETDAPCRST